AVGEPGRNLDLDFLAGRQPHARGRAFGGFRQGDRKCRAHVLAVRRLGEICRLEPVEAAAPSSPAAPEPAHHLAENIFETPEPAPAGATPRAAKSFRAPGETFEIAVAAKSRMTSAAETAEARLALRVDLAGVKGLTLFFVAEHFVGRVDFGELHGGPR